MTMSDKKYYLGIDLGTSSVKGMLKSPDGDTFRARCAYEAEEPQGWLCAVRTLIGELKALSGGKIAALSLSSQVGTYIVNGSQVIPWSSGAGKEELDYIKSLILPKDFFSGIGMMHPDLVSYPLPRLLYIQTHFGESVEVMMPKELIIRELTGNTVTDVFSMRGIANPSDSTYATDIIDRVGIKIPLHKLRQPTDLAGYVTDRAAAEYGLDAGTPVYLGCNDFFAGLLGMGVYSVGDFFDLSGTSEHVGYISDAINSEAFVSGGYFNGICSYGGTKASGASCDLAINCFGIEDVDVMRALSKKPPVFLPYLCGERAPIFDEKARGVYFGLGTQTDKECLAYSTLEGVIFSLYDIISSMNAPKPEMLICGGGSARNGLMNLLRATVFDCDVVCTCENDTSALGACMLAMLGDGVYPDAPSAIRDCVKYHPAVNPLRPLRDILMSRFGIYKSLYADLGRTFEKFSLLD